MTPLVKSPTMPSEKPMANQANSHQSLGPLTPRPHSRRAADRQLPTTVLAVPLPPKILGLPWNVIDNKGPKMRKMGRMRLPWNVYENKRLNLAYPGMLLINKVVSSF